MKSFCYTSPKRFRKITSAYEIHIKQTFKVGLNSFQLYYEVR